MMPSAYRRELDFTLSLLEHLRMPVHFLQPGDSLRDCDGGLRAQIGITGDEESLFRGSAHWARERTIYKILDSFMCRYIYFRLPGTEPSTAVVIGPYLSSDPAPGDILEMAEALGLPLSVIPQMSDYYAARPVYHDPGVLLSIVTTLGEHLWGGKEFDMVDVNDEQQRSIPSDVSIAAPIEQENILRRMQQLETRYAYENELMEIVSKGLTHQAEVMMSGVSHLNYQPRVPDPLRNMKNYCIICNTLLRKAAQQGGVHPLYLDAMSGQFARAIETSPAPDKCSSLIGDMIRAYCRLVRTHGGQQHSAAVQKALTYISANLSGNLSLTTLSALLRLSPSYLSALFHRETGVTLAEHIASQRMKAALQLLKSTRLQVQNVAQLCGFSDPNYFGKQFKRHFGITPTQYRQEHFHQRNRPSGS